MKMASCCAMSRSMTASLLSAWLSTGHPFSLTEHSV
jgi:hypothetical protein